METLIRLPWMAQDSVFERLAQIADISALTKEERIKYDKSISSTEIPSTYMKEQN